MGLLRAGVQGRKRGRLERRELLGYSLGAFLLFPSLAPRYKSLCPETWPTWAGRPQDGVAVLVRHLGYKPEEYKMGR